MGICSYMRIGISSALAAIVFTGHTLGIYRQGINRRYVLSLGFSALSYWLCDRLAAIKKPQAINLCLYFS